MKQFLLTLVTLISTGVLSVFGGQKISLDGEWQLDYWEQGKYPVRSPREMEDVTVESISAQVPGNVELDLYQAGRIENPEIDSNVWRIRYLEGYQWRYSRHFKTPERENKDDEIILDFEGIDCYSDIYVNGKYVASTDNMLIGHCFDVTELLEAEGKDNLVEVFIRSSVIEARKRIPPVLSNNWDRPETVTTRRAPHSYGWDIMPRLVSAGIWRSVSLQVRPAVHIRDAHWMTAEVNTKNRTARLLLDCVISYPPKYQSQHISRRVCLKRKGKTVFEKTERVAMFSQRVKIALENVDFWWPRGAGDAALYEAEVTLLDKNGNIIDRNQKSIGIRTIQLDRSDIHTGDEPGRFCFYVNQEPIFIHGSNWTPLDALHSRDTQHLHKALALTVDLNCNMLRCWGGNVYEDDAFYDFCDKNGILIWQDFSMGCSYYPQSQWFQEALETEVEFFVRKVRSHPCIALWAGNNENDEMMCDGNFSFYKPDPGMDKVSRVTLPYLLFELDPTRPYLPSSPYWSERYCQLHYGNTDALPERHLWGPRGYYKDPFYTSEAQCLFASETGYHGMPSRSSLEKMFTADKVYPWTDKKNFRWKDEWIAKAVTEYEEYGYRPDRNNLMINQVKSLFGTVPTDLDEFIFASQSVQAEAMKFFVERFRGRKFSPCTGILWWNIRDGWPIISDAVVDWYFSPKMAYWFLRNVQRDVCVMALDAASDGRHPLVAVNDTRSEHTVNVVVTDIESRKRIYEGNIRIPSNGKCDVATLTGIEGQGMIKIAYRIDNGDEIVNHYLYGQPPFCLKDYRKWLKKASPEGLAL